MESNGEDIAIVGIGCHFPGGEGLDNFWNVLLEGKVCAVEIPEERFDSTQWYDPDEDKPGKSRTAKAALIDGFNTFDHKFFGISEAEADYMDPQQKLLLECSYRALENAGIPLERASGTQTGVFIGLMNRDYETLLNNSATTITHYNGTGTAMSIAANRISYTFNLTGPSYAIDSACSSSLVALHCAIQAIKQGDCEMALCGGVSCIIEPRVFVALSKAKMISPEGTSKPFSSRADGYGRGEGCGIVLLKPLKKALKDLDHVWGIITKTGVNQDGCSTSPITKPSVAQQEELLRKIYAADIDPSHIQYIEAHGTGTPVGDPIEAESISRVISKARDEPLYIGSVKGNIGHTESAAGVAGLIKVLLMMQHETIVPSVSYFNDSSSIDSKSLNLKIPTKPENWESGSYGRVAGINNFGFGGTNAHAVVRQHEGKPKSFPIVKEHYLVVFSSASEKSFKMILADTAKKLSSCDKVDLHALAYTTACRRSHKKHKYRKVFKAGLSRSLQADIHSCMENKILPSTLNPPLVFVFCGNGVTYRGMCKQLLSQEPVFRKKVKEVERLFQNYETTYISEKLIDDYDNDDFSKPNVVQPLLFAIQVGITSLLKHWGIKPDAVLGHSVGEVAAAHCSGLLSLEDAVKVIHFRSRLQSQVAGGKMLVVGNMAVSETLNLLPMYSGKVCLAAFNSPQSCTLSGDADAVESLHDKLTSSFHAKNLFLHFLDVPAAYHSHMMDPILSQIENSIGTLQGNPVEAELFSTVTGKVYTSEDYISGTYWARNIREPVVFEQALRSVANEYKNAVFVEISPRKALQRNIGETLGNHTRVLASSQPEHDRESMLTLLSILFELGVQVNWEEFYEGYEVQPTSFPVYQFDSQKKEVYFEAVRRGNEVTSESCHPLVTLGKQKGEFNCNLSLPSASYVWQHKHNGIAVVPGALYVELALASFVMSVKLKEFLWPVQLSIRFQNMFVLTKNCPGIKVQLEEDENKTQFTVHSSLATYASGTIDCISGGGIPVVERKINLDAIFRRCNSIITTEQAYRILSQAGFQYGPVFQQLGDIHYGSEFQEGLSAVTFPNQTLHQVYCLHPLLLDCFLQMSAVVSATGLLSRPALPSAISQVTVLKPLLNKMLMYLRTTAKTSEYFEVCGYFADNEGQVLVEMRNVRLTFLGEGTRAPKDCFFHNELRLISEDGQLTDKPKALVLEDQLGYAKALQTFLHQDSMFISNCKKQSFLLHSGAYLDFQDVLFMCGIENPHSLNTEMVLEHLLDCCELFRQIVNEIRKDKHPHSVRVITYRCAEKTVDHVSPGFVLSGMTRSCAAEISDVSFQLIDLASVSSEDLQALVHVICLCDSSKYPEVMIHKGQIFTSAVVHTSFKSMDNRQLEKLPTGANSFILQTLDPYSVKNLSAILSDVQSDALTVEAVEVQVDRICVHSSEFFPTTVSELHFGQTIYFSHQASQNHTLMALDFCGRVTAVGKDVSKLKVGDHVVSCYPVAASSLVIIPEVACYKSQKLPFLKKLPCISDFVLAWEILHRALPKVKQNKTMCIISSNLNSSLMKVLALTSIRCGWNVVQKTRISLLLEDVHKCDTFILLPPTEKTLLAEICSVPTVKHIIQVCGYNETSHYKQNTPGWHTEDVYMQTLHLARIFQKAYLKCMKTKIYSWIKSMLLHKTSLDFQAATLHKTVIELHHSPFPGVNGSNFNLKTHPVVLNDELRKTNIPVRAKPQEFFKHSSVYIVTGGLSGLGLETVKFIAQRGGRFIVVLSRNTPSAEIQLEINILQSQCGVSIFCLQCDVSVSEQVTEAITTIRLEFPILPISGVFHSAVVLHDGILEAMDRSSFEKVLRPKVNGVLNLHYATLNCNLDYFVCYSSISSFIGNASQTNYAAANSFLDMFCHYRRNQGLVGQSINWGALNLGLLLNKEHFHRFLEAKGMGVLKGPEFHECLEHCLLLNNPQQVVCKFNFRNLRRHVLSQNASLKARLSVLAEEELKHTAVSEPTIAEPNFPPSTEEYVRSVLSKISMMDPHELSSDTTLFAIGIDSMLAMTLQNHIFHDRGVTIPLVNLLDPHSTLATLVSMITDRGILTENQEDD